MNQQQRDTTASGILAKTLDLPIPPHRIYQSPQHYNLNPIKRTTMQRFYGTLSLTGFTLFNIFNEFKIEDWKAILSLLGALVMLVMWAHSKMKDRKQKDKDNQHKNRMRDLEYQERLTELNKKLNQDNYNEEKELGI